MPAKKKNGPEKTFRIGAVSASIFCNTAESANGRTRDFRNVQLQRSFRDGEEWRTSSSFALSDLPQAIRCLELALRYVEDQEAEVS